MSDDGSRLVLVVDDDDIIRRVVRTVLEADDFEVVEAKDGDEAIQKVSTDHPLVVVLDVMMPGLDGVEVCRRVRADGTKVLMLTARDDADVEQASKDAGADGFLAKPFSSVELLDKVEQLTRRSGRAT
ncbi:MAG TPA: response regulator [Acidimicrobiales bacterium]|jgi:two-component system response regulator MprA|nr:response regulator [Acidimicrobiales bacterium]